MLHAKTLIVDDDWADLGSSNFDHRSFALDAEMNVSFYDQEIVAELERHFLDDVDASVEFDLERWRNRPLGKRAGEYAGELVRQSF